MLYSPQDDGRIIIFATIKQSAMSEEEKKLTPNPDGYDITIYPEYWTTVLSVVISIVSVYMFKGMLKPLFSSLNVWLFLGVFCIILSIPVYLSMFLIWKLTNAKVNIRLTDVGLEQRKVSGPSWIPDFQVVKWEEMDYYFLFGRRNRAHSINGDDFFIGTKLDKDYAFSAMTFSRSDELNKTMKAFRSEFLRLANKKGIKRHLLWEEKQESFDKKHLE